MKLKVIGYSGNEEQEIEADTKIFGLSPNLSTVYRAIHNERSNKRLGTASTKGRAMVKGSTKKPWKQKGMGRSRAGSAKSPIWRGGGIVFGPSPRDYSYKIPRKMKKLSILSILSERCSAGRLRVIEDIELKEARTKEARDILYNMSLLKNETKEIKNNKLQKKLNSYRLVIITDDSNVLLKKSIRNLPWVRYLSYKRLNAYDLFYAHEVMLEKKVLPKLESLYLLKEVSRDILS